MTPASPQNGTVNAGHAQGGGATSCTKTADCSAHDTLSPKCRSRSKPALGAPVTVASQAETRAGSDTKNAKAGTKTRFGEDRGLVSDVSKILQNKKTPVSFDTGVFYSGQRCN